MRLHSLWLVALAATPAYAGAATRLPATVTPVRYELTLAPDLAKSTFTGHEAIELDVKAQTRTVAIHAADLAIERATVSAGGRSLPAKIAYDAKNELALLALPEALPPGHATLELAWSGKLSDKLRGLYAAESDGRRYAFTQFEATDARRAFPCFDEPAFKARFQVTAIVDAAHVAVSNGAIREQTLSADKLHKTVRFAETPPMSSYLVALAVGPLVEVRGASRPGKTPIRVYATPGKEKLAGYALETAEALLDKLSAYFGIAYPYGKLDLVGVPDFAAGAMENTGAIFFREAALLIDPKNASAEQRRYVALILAHEMAHQWFGDLVTMQWWDDLWLNEAFATWMENKAVEQIRPDWNIWLDFEGDKTYALGLDSLGSTHPIRTPVRSPEDANENFDGITYSKGGAVLRMLEQYLGEPVFQKGVSAYLREHSNGNATAADLWRALSEASGKPVAEVAHSWFEQPGYPVVSAERTCKDGATTLALEQHRFFANPAQKSAGKWLIPLCVRTDQGSECTLLREPKANLTLKAPGCAAWAVVNPKRAGFYRVRYQPAELAALGQVAEAQLDAPERIGLVDDAWALVRQGGAPLKAYLDVVQGLRGEREREVTDELAAHLGVLEEYLLAERDRPAFAQLVDELLRPLADELGWEPKANETDARRLLRGTVLTVLGDLARAPDVLAEVTRRLPGYLEEPSSLEGTVGEVVMTLGAKTGDAAVYDSYLVHLRASRTPVEHSRLLHALAEFESPELVKRTLDLTLTPDVKVQDVSRLVGRLFANPKARASTWSFLKANFAALKKKAPPFGFDRVVGATAHFCDEGVRKEVAAFFADPAHKIESSGRALKQAQEAIHLCADLKAREAANLSTWLKSRAPKHAKR
jgi:aminopeptidase N